MNNSYTYDAVKNITKVVNTGSEVAPAGTISGAIGGHMEHNYKYDNLYRLVEAHGDYNKTNTTKNAHYDLFMGYDNMHNVVSKRQEINQNGVQFTGGLTAGYNLSYSINADNCQQISNIADQSYRYEGTNTQVPEYKLSQYSYDANGNLLSVNTGKRLTDSTLQATYSRKLLWDEENRLLALSDNGFVSNYWYDAAGERTVKLSGDAAGVAINGVSSAALTGTTNFTAYISPYMVVRNGGEYTKHIYMGSQRITSKVSSSSIFIARNPLNDTTALNKNYTAKLSNITTRIKERFDSLGVKYSGVQQSGGLISSSPLEGDLGGSYFYHPDHLGSSSLITNGSGDLVQHIQYVPFGEVFVEERNSNWSTPYLFNGKERDAETGLSYYGARYYDPRTSVWLSVDPLAEEKPFISSYVYCRNNPINMIDPDGRDEFNVDGSGNLVSRIPNLKKDVVQILDDKGKKIDGKSVEFKYGTISSFEIKNSGTSKEYEKYQVKGNKNGQKLFEFLADNTSVEWGKIDYYSNNSTITTSNEKGTLYGNVAELIDNLKFDVKSVTHSHPGGTDYPSGASDGRTADVGVAKKYEKRYGNVNLNIYLPNRSNYVNERYIPYNSKSLFFDFRNHPDNKTLLPTITVNTKRK